jgi:hypothetical protein
VVRDDPMIPRTHQADATCGTASLSNYSASRHYHTRLFVNDGFNAQLPVQSNSF